MVSGLKAEVIHMLAVFNPLWHRRGWKLFSGKQSNFCFDFFSSAIRAGKSLEQSYITYMVREFLLHYTIGNFQRGSGLEQQDVPPQLLHQSPPDRSGPPTKARPPNYAQFLLKRWWLSTVLNM